ncbi:MAG TPA: hypothetical protein VHF26_16010, partial [Trebonia sp.]|nr:hypothetical protein [Trebonia sp.]
MTTAATTSSEDPREAVAELPRLLPPPEHKTALDARAHTERYGSLPYRDRPGSLIADIEAAGLTGRGGAAFPVHRKLQAVLDAD